MTYVKIMLTLLVAATAVLAYVMRPSARSSSPTAIAQSPTAFEAALIRTIDSVDFRSMPAQAAIEVVRNKSGVDIRVDWISFEHSQNPLYPADPVTFAGENLPLIDVLNGIFKADGNRYVGYNAIGNRVDVTTGLAPDAALQVRSYDIRDLISDDYWGVQTLAGREHAVHAARIRNLLDLIEHYVDKGEWDPTFGGMAQGGHMTEFSGRLMVVQTSIGHQRVANILSWLRKMR